MEEALSADPDWVAPNCLESEVFATIRNNWQRGRIDEMTAALAVRDLASWPGELMGQALLLEPAWSLRHNVSAWDALYVALAKSLNCPLVTLDERLARAVDIEVLVP